MKEIEGRKYFSLIEVALLTLNPSQIIKRWCMNGWIDTIKIDNEYYIEEKELKALKRYLKHNPALTLTKDWKQELKRKSK